MSASATLVLIVGLGLIAWASARARAFALAPQGRNRPRPAEQGWYAALWTAIPALLIVGVWAWSKPFFVRNDVLNHPAAQDLPSEAIDRAAVLSEARDLANGAIDAAFNPLAETLAMPWVAAEQKYALVGLILAIATAVGGGAFGMLRLKPGFRAGPRVERFALMIAAAASLIAIVTTAGIVLSLVVESMRFFALVSPVEFLFGTTWAPETSAAGTAAGSYGATPLFWGTVFIGAIIAMLVAVPLGLMSAIYLTQYAKPKIRAWIKPLLEVLAGVPTVVYGYFAALTVAPAVRDIAAAVGVTSASSESALAAGVVMGVMIVPFVSSMADDALTAVPRAMRDGALALGSTTSETIRQVLLPAALPGVVGGVLLAVSRAIGETMIVVMAAGLAANLTLNPLASVTTVTAQIVQLLTGDQEFESAKTLAAFALGLVLFVVTLGLNMAALSLVKAYREAYE
ncbi:MAG: phosphate ABC transporter permease subunit PstC [Alphaproteobacteria bacterium]|nr:phosphate ABC transporter permease subunit PstC [Alphaproteobacteria bacterium]